MLDELRKIIASRVGTLDLSPLRERFGTSTPLRTPAEMFDVAQALCRIASEGLSNEAASPAQEGADLLIRFVAEMPEALARAVRDVPAFTAPAERAWLEPVADAFVALACTVQDVWAHLLGPESDEDDAIAAALLWHQPHTALDFGCGAGHFAHLLARSGVEVDGIEIDPLKQAFFNFRARESGLTSRMRLGLHRESYDMVVALNVLDHMEDPTPALAAFRAAIPSGRVLCTLAAFPHDGWHQSDAAVVAACGEELWGEYTLSEYPHALPPWMDCWIRRSRPSDALTPSSRPRLSPGSTFHREDGGRVVLHANRFYSRSLVLDDETADICMRFDGDASVRDIAVQSDVEAEELIDLCSLMQEAGHLYLPPLPSSPDGSELERPAVSELSERELSEARAT